jgi:hypothetical protein
MGTVAGPAGGLIRIDPFHISCVLVLLKVMRLGSFLQGSMEGGLTLLPLPSSRGVSVS